MYSLDDNYQKAYYSLLFRRDHCGYLRPISFEILRGGGMNKTCGEGSATKYVGRGRRKKKKKKKKKKKNMGEGSMKSSSFPTLVVVIRNQQYYFIFGCVA